MLRHLLKRVPQLQAHLAAFTPRLYSQNTEERIRLLIKKQFPNAKVIDVSDVSGGCGAMFDICIQSPDFKGLSLIKQHRLVTDALKEEIKDMHGLRIHTTPV